MVGWSPEGGSGYPVADFVCDDGIDNDGDGFIDYPSDPDCSMPGDGSESPAAGGRVIGAAGNAPSSVNGTSGTATAIAKGLQYDHSCAIQSGTGAVVCW